MNKVILPVQSTRTLFKATAYALLIAGIILVTTILPVEYNIDPTGIGKALGLAGMHEQPTSVTKTEKSDQPLSDESVKYRTDTATILVPAGSGVEYKFQLDKAITLNRLDG